MACWSPSHPTSLVPLMKPGEGIKLCHSSLFLMLQSLLPAWGVLVLFHPEASVFCGMISVTSPGCCFLIRQGWCFPLGFPQYRGPIFVPKDTTDILTAPVPAALRAEPVRPSSSGDSKLSCLGAWESKSEVALC